MSERLAVVTGGTRGIGQEIGRQLAAQGLGVVLTGRDAGRGTAAAAAIQAGGHRAEFHPLDVTDQTSVRRLVKYLADTYGRCDVLVNNAGVYLDRGQPPLEVDLALVRQTMETNYFGPLRLIQLLVPLMRRHGRGRIVNVSSRMGVMSPMGAGALAYRSSKAALNALTQVVAHELAGTNILINAASPGWVRTDMGGPHAGRSVAQGADTAVWLATLPDGGPSGGFFHDRQQIAW